MKGTFYLSFLIDCHYLNKMLKQMWHMHVCKGHLPLYSNENKFLTGILDKCHPLQYESFHEIL